MQIVLDSHSILHAILHPESDITAVLKTGCLGINADLLNEYNEEARRKNLLPLYQAWFQKHFISAARQKTITHSHNRFSFPCSYNNKYIATSKLHSNIYIKSQKNTTIRLDNLLDEWGIRHFQCETIAPPLACDFGNSVIYSQALTPGGRTSPDGLLWLFKKEPEITIFDRYFFRSKKSKELINHLIDHSIDCEITILYSPEPTSASAKKKLEEATEINDTTTLLKSSNPYHQIKILPCTRTSIKVNHDRFIFIDNKYLITLTNSLDCFGQPGNWINRQAAITARNTLHCAVNASFEAEDGPNKLTIYRKY